MKKTNKLFALILALVLTVSIAVCAPAASAQTADVAETGAGTISNPQSYTIGKTVNVTVGNSQTYYYQFTLSRSGIATLSADMVDDGSSEIAFLNAQNNTKLEYVYVYGNSHKNKDFYLKAGTYKMSVQNSTFYSRKFTVMLTFKATTETIPESLTKTNDIAVDAFSIKVGQIIDGQLGARADKDDYYKFTPSADQLFSVSSTALATGRQEYMEVYDPSMKKIADNMYNLNYVTFPAQKGKTYYIRISKESGGEEGLYRMQLKAGNPAITSVKFNNMGTAISWKGVGIYKDYCILRKLSGGTWKMIETVRGTSGTYTDTSVKFGAKCSYTIRAYVNKNAFGIWTAKNTPAVIPVIKSLVTNTKHRINPIWNTVTGASGYDVQISTDKTFKRSVVMKRLTGKRSYVFNNMKKGARYYVRVRAIKYCDDNTYGSGWSNVKTIVCK